MPDAEGVASYVTVKLPVWLGKTVFCQAPAAIVVTHTGVLLTVRPTVAVWLVLPLVPVMVSVEVLCGAVLLVVMVSVAEPGAFTELALNVAVTPAGAPLTLSATAPLNPFTTPTLTVELVLLPAVTVSELGDADTEKSGGGGGCTVNDTLAVCVRLPLTPVTVNV